MKIILKSIKLFYWLIPVMQSIWKIIRRKINMNEVNIEELGEKVLTDLKSAKDISADIAAVKEAVAKENNVIKKAISGAKSGLVLITHVVSHVEAIGEDLKLAGAQKKELAVAVLNRLIDLPLLPENMEAVIIGFAIDAIVTGFNVKFGNAWLTKAA